MLYDFAVEAAQEQNSDIASVCADIFDYFGCFQFTQREFVLIASVFSDKLYEGVYDKGVVLSRYRESSARRSCRLVLVFEKLCLLDYLTGIGKEFRAVF